jgi:myo-inositol-1(or 4)-monophosphatase
MKEILAIALDAGLQAAGVARSHFDDLSALDFTVKDTGKHPGADVVSAADTAVEALIRRVISSARPQDSILGEEGGLSVGADTGLTWIIDPIDGTLNFSYHRNAFAVSIAACDEQGPVVGVVVQVEPQRVFAAVRGQGATCNGVPIRASAVTELAMSLVDIGRGRDDSRGCFGAVVTTLDELARDIRRGGCAALAACEIASGELDAMYGPSLAVWDICAGGLIAEEAGAVQRHAGDDVILVAAAGVIDEFDAVITRALA